MQFKAVVFDMGGVIKTYSKMDFIEKIIEFVMKDSRLLKTWADLEKGILTMSDVRGMMKELSGTFPEIAQAAATVMGNNNSEKAAQVDFLPDDPNFAVAVPKIKDAGFQIALLTNNCYVDQEKTKSMVMQNAGSIFDTVVESCKVGYRKPEVQIYQLVADRLGVKPEECIMVDDLFENCEGAKKAGMAAVQVKHMDSATAVGELERLLNMKIL